MSHFRTREFGVSHDFKSVDRLANRRCYSNAHNKSTHQILRSALIGKNNFSCRKDKAGLLPCSLACSNHPDFNCAGSLPPWFACTQKLANEERKEQGAELHSIESGDVSGLRTRILTLAWRIDGQAPIQPNSTRKPSSARNQRT